MSEYFVFTLIQRLFDKCFETDSLVRAMMNVMAFLAIGVLLLGVILLIAFFIFSTLIHNFFRSDTSDRDSGDDD